MSTPMPPPPGPAPREAKKLVVVPSYGKREVMVGILAAVAVVVLIVLAVMKLGTDRSPNMVKGTIESHYQTGVRETLLDVSSKGVKGKTADTGFYLKVRVAKENRVYDVMVSEDDWKRYKTGETLEFLRPEEEQR